MSQLLRIDASSRTIGSQSRELADFFVKQWTHNNPKGSIVKRDLLETKISHISANTITGFYTPTDEQDQILKEAIKLSDELIAELMSADTVLISTPMYNFSVPSVLKAWIDQIVRSGKTFNFSPETGFEGLVKNKRAYVITVTGAVFSNDGMEALDFLTPYLQSLLHFLGFTEIEFFTVEGTTTDESALKISKEIAQNKMKNLEGIS